MVEVRGIEGAAAAQSRLQERVRYPAMRIVLDAHVRIEPVGGSEDRPAVIERLVLDVEREVDPDLAQRVLNYHRVVGDLLEALGGEPCLEAVGDASGRQELAGLSEVLLALRYAGIGRRVNRRER